MAESWTITPSEGVTNNNNGTFVFPKNTGCTDIVYTIDYTDASGCTGTTTYTIPKHENYEGVDVFFNVMPDYGAACNAGIVGYNISASGGLSVTVNGWGQLYASGDLLTCNDYSIQGTIYTNKTAEYSDQCDPQYGSSGLLIQPDVRKNGNSIGEFVPDGIEQYAGTYLQSVSLVNEDARITIRINISPGFCPNAYTQNCD